MARQKDASPPHARSVYEVKRTAGSTTASEPFAYDPATDTYRFTWKTQKAWAGWCGTLTVALADGERYDLEVRFKP